MVSPAPSLPRRFARLTLLNVLSNITVPLASLVDTALLGHLADLRFLAGVALAAVLFEYLYWSFGFLRMGTTGTTAQAWGRSDQPAVFLTLYRSLLVAFVLAGAILLLQVPLREAGFGLLSGAPEVENAGRSYFNARIWAAPAALANFALLGWFLGREESGAALWMTIVANVANIVLDYVFIVRLNLAAFGAGLGTTISQYLMLICGLTLWYRRPGRIPCRWSDVIDPPALRVMFQLNRDILVRTISLITVFALFANGSALLGTVVLAANTVLLRLISLVAYLVDGAAFAAESLGGVFGGAGDGRAFARLYRGAMITGILLTLPLLTLFVWAPDAVIGVLTSHPEAISVARTYIPWLIPVLLFGALAYIYDGLFLGLTAGRSLRNTMLVSTLGVFVPLAALAVHLGQNHLLWLALTLFMVARTFTLWRVSRWVFPTAA
jgi:MATE family multidrug resistance protein